MSYIPSRRLERVLGELPRENAWEGSRHRTALETVDHDHRPVRAVMGAIMTTLATGVGLIVGGYVAMDIAHMLISIATQLSSAF